ncbi:unnamed protein product [Caenorhabditis brenneri]
MNILNKICTTIAIAKTAWIVLFFFLIQLPFDYDRLDFFPSTLFRMFCGLWLTYSVSYHYWKARYAKPVRLPQKTPSGPNCSFCSLSKPFMTSHCRTCNTCIVKRDHHCPWMGQCIGVHNQANFFLFLFNVYLSTVLVLFVEYEFWLEYFKVWLKASTWSVLNEGHGKVAVFSLSIVISLHIIMISFVITYAFLVSGGFIIINMLFGRETKKSMSLSMIILRWRQYLTVRHNDSIIRALFIPSDRTIQEYDLI